MAANAVEKAFCVLELSKTNCITVLQRPQLHEDNFIFRQDGAPPHWHREVRNYLDANLPQPWIGRATGDNMSLTCWPSRSLDLTPCDFMGLCQRQGPRPSVPVTLDDPKQRITTATTGVGEDTLTRVWQEFDYRVDTCRVTKGAHIEQLQVAVMPVTVAARFKA
jgi:hypothetical protein